jgi:hypothetical protein
VNLIRYRTRPESADENQNLIEGVFAGLRATPLPGVRYLVLRLADATFLHLIASEPDGLGSSIVALPAFRDFQKGVGNRCLELPHSTPVTLVGNHRMLLP